MSQQPKEKRIHFDTRNREIFFLDKNSEIIKDKKRIHLKDHIEFENKSWMLIEDDSTKDLPEERIPRAPTLQTVKCAYCVNNVDPETEELKPLKSTLETEKPEYVKTLKAPSFDADGNFITGISLYRIVLHCSNGHHIVKHYREYVTRRAYDFLTYEEESKYGLLDPLMPDT